MNPGDEHYMVCKCEIIIEDLLDFLNEIIFDPGEQQWEKLGIFMSICSHWNSYGSYADRDRFHPCLLKLCGMISDRYECADFEQRKDMELHILIINVLSYFYLDPHCLFDKEYLEFVVKNEHEIPEDIQVTIRILTALNGRPKIMNMLLNLDLVQSPKASTQSLIDRSITYHLHKFTSLHKNSVPNCVVKKIVDSAKKAHRGIFPHKHDESFKRIYLATIAVRAIQFKLDNKENSAEDFVYCLRMYFAATPDPLLTINEVRIILYACLDPLKKLDLFESHCEQFMLLMPECPATLEPRNLTDIVRLQIRKYLKKCGLPLPAAVENLTLPKLLTSFVLGDVIDLSRKSGIASSHQIITRTKLEGLLKD